MEYEMKKNIIQAMFGMKIDCDGIENAYNDMLKDMFEGNESDVIKKFVEEVGEENATLKLLLEQTRIKLEFIDWAASLKDFSKLKQELPFLVNELRNIANDLENKIKEGN